MNKRTVLFKRLLTSRQCLLWHKKRSVWCCTNCPKGIGTLSAPGTEERLVHWVWRQVYGDVSARCERLKNNIWLSIVHEESMNRVNLSTSCFGNCPLHQSRKWDRVPWFSTYEIKTNNFRKNWESTFRRVFIWPVITDNLLMFSFSAFHSLDKIFHFTNNPWIVMMARLYTDHSYSSTCFVFLL